MTFFFLSFKKLMPTRHGQAPVIKDKFFIQKPHSVFDANKYPMFSW